MENVSIWCVGFKISKNFYGKGFGGKVRMEIFGGVLNEWI